MRRWWRGRELEEVTEEPGNLGHPSADWLGGSHRPWLPPPGEAAMGSHGASAGQDCTLSRAPSSYPKIAFLFRSVCSVSQSSGDAISWQVLDILRPSLSHCLRTFPAKNSETPLTKATGFSITARAAGSLTEADFEVIQCWALGGESQLFLTAGWFGVDLSPRVLLLGDPGCCDLSWRSLWFCSASPGTSQAHPFLHRSVPGDSPDMSAQAKKCEELVWITSCAKCSLEK